MAHALTNGSSSVVIAILGSGLDYQYNFIKKALWTNYGEIANNSIDDDHNGYVDDVHGWNFLDNNNNIMDNYGQGTFIASQILGFTNQEIASHSLEGIAPKVTLMPVKILNGTSIANSTQIVNAVKYAVNNGANIITMSFHYLNYFDLPPKNMVNIFNWAYSRGVFLDVSSGSDARAIPHLLGPSVNGIGQISGVMAVGSVNSSLQRSSFSQYGTHLGIVAPGEDVYGLWIMNKVINYTTSYLEINGTNFNGIPMDYTGTTLIPVSTSIVYAGSGLLSDYNSINATNKIVLVIPTTITTYSEMALNAESEGAVGLLVSNDKPGEFTGSLGSFTSIPVVGISQQDGATIYQMIKKGISIVQFFLLKVGQVICKQSHFKPIFLTKDYEN